MKTSPDYHLGRAAGLREAVDILRELEALVAIRLRRQSDRRTRDARRTRHKAYGVAASRVETAVRKAQRRSIARAIGFAEEL